MTSTLSVKPYKGSHFALTRLLLLGESAYSWTEKGETVHPSAHHPRDSVDWITSDFYGKGLRFLRTLSRGITNEEHPKPDQLKAAWDRVAFANYVPGTIGEFGSRPRKEHWDRARSEFPALLECVKPLRMIVLGRTMWRKLSPCADVGEGLDAYAGKSFATYAFKLSSGELCWCQPVSHPRAGLSWRTLAALILA
jgi:hypothetical protein